MESEQQQKTQILFLLPKHVCDNFTNSAEKLPTKFNNKLALYLHLLHVTQKTLAPWEWLICGCKKKKKKKNLSRSDKCTKAIFLPNQRSQPNQFSKPLVSPVHQARINGSPRSPMKSVKGTDLAVQSQWKVSKENSAGTKAAEAKLFPCNKSRLHRHIFEVLLQKTRRQRPPVESGRR